MVGHAEIGTLSLTFMFGALWGIGGLTFGLAMRYLGMSLGMGVALGYSAAFGTLIPPFFKLSFPSISVPETIAEIASSTAGQVTLLGVAVCLLGIFIAALAGATKDTEISMEETRRPSPSSASKKAFSSPHFPAS